MRSHPLVLVAACALLSTTAAPAQNVTPIVYDLAPAGPGAAREVEFWNSQNLIGAIEITVSRRSFDSDGRPVDEDAGGAIEVSPAQFLVAPGARQKVRVRYVGPEALAGSVTYAISFHQLPLASPDNPRLRFLFDFKTIANVVPAGATDDITVEAIDVNGSQARLVFRNRGRRYGRIDQAPLRLRSRSQAIVLDEAALRDRYDLRWLEPGATRVVSVPVPFAAGEPVIAERLGPGQS